MVSKTTIIDGYRDERDDGVYMHAIVLILT